MLWDWVLDAENSFFWGSANTGELAALSTEELAAMSSEELAGLTSDQLSTLGHRLIAIIQAFQSQIKYDSFDFDTETKKIIKKWRRGNLNPRPPRNPVARH